MSAGASFCSTASATSSRLEPEYPATGSTSPMPEKPSSEVTRTTTAGWTLWLWFAFLKKSRIGMSTRNTSTDSTFMAIPPI